MSKFFLRESVLYEGSKWTVQGIWEACEVTVGNNLMELGEIGEKTISYDIERMGSVLRQVPEKKLERYDPKWDSEEL